VCPDFTPDPILDLIGREPDVVALIGYVDDADDHIRLFRDPELRVWMDIPKSEVVERHRIAAEEDLFGGRSLVWVRGPRMREPIDSGLRQSMMEAFLIGEFAAEVLLPETLEDAAERLTFLPYRTGKWYCP
jgi:hypothetical protein